MLFYQPLQMQSVMQLPQLAQLLAQSEQPLTRSQLTQPQLELK